MSLRIKQEFNDTIDQELRERFRNVRVRAEISDMEGNFICYTDARTLSLGDAYTFVYDPVFD